MTLTPRDRRAMFGMRLRACAKLRGHSCPSLATAIGVARQNVYLWWKGSGYPRPEQVLKLAEALHFSPAFILFGDVGLQEQENMTDLRAALALMATA